MVADPSIGVTMLAYNEPSIDVNLRSWLPHARRIVVVVGAIEDVASVYPAVDAATIAAVRSVNDPESKIRLITRNGYWRDKNEMQWIAANELDGDLHWQVDADEFYLSEDIEHARRELVDDRWLLAAFPHRIFWKDLTQVLTTEAGDDGWFVPARIWRRREGERFLHLPFGSIQRLDGSLAHDCQAPDRVFRQLRVFHTSWCGPDARLQFKFEFHRQRGDGPSPAWLRDVWHADVVPPQGVHPAQEGIFPRTYDGPLPKSVVEAAQVR